MKLSSELEEAFFLRRPNRFAAVFRLSGREVVAHVANSGRLGELLRPGRRAFLAPATGTRDRKTSHDLALVEVDGLLVSADARLPPALLAEAIEAGAIPEFRGHRAIRREVLLGRHRLDLLLTFDWGPLYVEVKSVTLVEHGIGLFPDAPTRRGREHVEALAAVVAGGRRGAVAFVVQRSDADCVAPNDGADPAFGRALRLAASKGVEAYAYRCAVRREEVRLTDRVPVRLE